MKTVVVADDGNLAGRGRGDGPEPENGARWRRGEPATASRPAGDARQALHGVVRAAVVNIPGADHAGIALVDRHRRVTTQAATDDLVRLVDRLQDELRQGPSVDATRVRGVVRVDDLATEGRWPLFAPRACELGVGSLVSIAVIGAGADLGVLTVYAPRPAALDDVDEQIGVLLAAHSTVAVLGESAEQNLADALHHRDVIGRAKGVLMQRHTITEEQAFSLLIKAAHGTNRSVQQIAADLVGDHDLPPA